MRISLTKLALSSALAAVLTASAPVGPALAAMKPIGEPGSIHLVRGGGSFAGGAMSNGSSMGGTGMGGMARSRGTMPTPMPGAMPGVMARGGMGGPTTMGGARGPVVPSMPQGGQTGQNGLFLGIPGLDGPVIPDTTPMRQPAIPSAPVLPGQSTLPAPPTVNN